MITRKDAPEAVITYLKAGLGRNMVSAEAVCEMSVTAEVRGEAAEGLRAAVSRTELDAGLDDKEALYLEETEDGFRLRAAGVSVHAMSPEKGLQRARSPHKSA